MYLKHQTKTFGSVVLAVLLTACGGGGGGGSNPPPATASSQAQSQQSVKEAFVLGGRVSDGPLSGADVAIYDRNGVLLASTISDANALYEVKLERDLEFPLRVSVSGGTDLVTMRAADFALTSHVFDAEQNITNVSSITTVVSNMVACREGITKQEFAESWGGASQALLVGLDESAVGDPLSSSTAANSITGFLLANEAVAEWIRRTANIMGETVSYAEVIESLACDLADGALDGNSPQPLGAQGLKSMMVARVLEPAIRLEILLGELHVDGTSATVAIDGALLSVQPDAELSSVRDVPLATGAATRLANLLGDLEVVLDSTELGVLKTTIANADQIDELRAQGLNVEWSMRLQGYARDVARSDSTAIAALAQQFENPNLVEAIAGTSSENDETAESPEQTPQNGSNDETDRSAVSQSDPEPEQQGVGENTLAGSNDPDLVEEKPGADEPQDNGSDTTSDQTIEENQNLLEGTVGYGLIRDAKVVVYDRNGAILSETTADPSGVYQLNYSAAAQFPLFVEASNGFDEAAQADQSFTLSAFVTDPAVSTAHLSTLTTLAQKAAACVEDYSQQRWNQIWGWSKKPITLGLKPERLAEPMWAGVAPAASSTYALSDQAVRELIQRSAVALEGVVATEGLLSTLGCELVDGRMNGVLPQGVTPVQERILMVLKAAEAQLRFELIAKNFTANQGDAYSRIDGALLRAQPANALIPSRELKVRFTALEDAVAALDRIALMDPALANLVRDLEKIANGAWGQVSAAVDADSQTLLRRTILAIARADDEAIRSLFRGQNINSNAQVSAQPAIENAGGSPSSESTLSQEGNDSANEEQQTQETSDTETFNKNSSSSNGNVSRSEPNNEPPTLALVGGSDEIDVGDSVQLSWQSTGADRCVADGGWSGVKAPTGSETVGPLSRSTTFSLSCEGAGGSALVLYAVEVFKTYQLSWVPPVENVDGSRVQGLSQFKIYYGTQSRVYDNFVPVDGREKSYSVSLPVGRYYFAVTAVDLEGDESQYSNEVVKQ